MLGLCREVCGADLPLIFLIPPGNSHTGNATNKNANNSRNPLGWTLINVPASSVSEVSLRGIRSSIPMVVESRRLQSGEGGHLTSSYSYILCTRWI